MIAADSSFQQLSVTVSSCQQLLAAVRVSHVCPYLPDLTTASSPRQALVQTIIKYGRTGEKPRGSVEKLPLQDSMKAPRGFSKE